MVLALVGATAFVIRTRDDLRAARAAHTRSEQNLGVLHARLKDTDAHRTEALAALEHEREVLRTDTEARDTLLGTDRVQYGLLVVALQTLSTHQAQLDASSTHAKLLDDCLTGASQVLNEAAVGDVEHLALTLPPVQQTCSQAAA